MVECALEGLGISEIACVIPGFGVVGFGCGLDALPFVWEGVCSEIETDDVAAGFEDGAGDFEAYGAAAACYEDCAGGEAEEVCYCGCWGTEAGLGLLGLGLGGHIGRESEWLCC